MSRFGFTGGAKQSSRWGGVLLDEAHRHRLELGCLSRNIDKARRTLRQKERKIQEAEATLHVKQQVRNFSLEDLGSGRRSCGGPTSKKNRMDVLQRLSTLGAGLSNSQKMEFKWFCEAWDSAGIADFAEHWPHTFSTWIQGVLESHEDAVVTAFSDFVHSETRRRLAGSVALALPGMR